MPEITRFSGIIIRMYGKSKEHNPPHFHASFGAREIAVNINTLEVVAGEFPGKIRDLTLEWAKLHQPALLEMWETQNFVKLPPLA